jgi:pimeloyl-ACP methyl ester carboxylesterase
MCEDMKIVTSFDRRDEVKGINLPTFIATGEKEILATVQISEYLHSQVQGSELFILKGLSHLMPVIAPEILAERIKLYFNNNPYNKS